MSGHIKLCCACAAGVLLWRQCECLSVSIHHHILQCEWLTIGSPDVDYRFVISATEICIGKHYCALCHRCAFVGKCGAEVYVNTAFIACRCHAHLTVAGEAVECLTEI